MKNVLGISTLTGIILGGISLSIVRPAYAQQSLLIVYPPPQHQTTAEQIFLIGSAPPEGQVLINGQSINRSETGNFAPSFPLEMGENVFTVRYQDQEVKINVTRVATTPEIEGVAFAKDSLTPSTNIARLPGELVCFEAVAPSNGNVSVRLGGQTIPLLPQIQPVELPPNYAALTGENEPIAQPQVTQYLGCTTFNQPTTLNNPTFQLSLNGKTVTEQTSATINILQPTPIEYVEVTAEEGVARTGPSTNYSRLTPLPKGTIAAVTGREGDWIRLNYGAWIRENETRLVSGSVSPIATIRSIRSRQVPGATEVVFPLTSPVPVSVQQGDRTFTLTLDNIVAQTDTIFVDADRVIKRVDWQQTTPTQTKYTFHLQNDQQWGYELRYEGSSLILSLNHPPTVPNNSLQGVEILLDPGHGGEELGARGPTGLPEKTVNLTVSQLLRDELQQRGATVYMTRETDVDLSLRDRMDMIDNIKPAIALSIHYNALPDSGDAINTAGVSAFWYHPQAHDLAQFLHDYLVENLDRPSYGVHWNNLALTRPHTAPSVLLELGFMINPEEFEWITNPEEQKQLANVLADGIEAWFQQQ